MHKGAQQAQCAALQKPQQLGKISDFKIGLLHVGNSEVDDGRVRKRRALASRVVTAMVGRPAADVPQPDFEIADLTELLGLL